VSGTYVVHLFSGSELAMFLAPCAIAALLIAPFAARLDDRRLSLSDRPRWSLRELLSTFYVDPRRNPDFTWAFASRFLFVTAYAFLVTYQAYFLIDRVGSDEDDIPRLIFHSTLVQSAVVVVASLAGGRLSDRTGRRKAFVLTASATYGVALLAIASSTDFDRFLVAMALAGLGFGVYVAVDLALVADVLPDESSTAKDLGVFNMAGALPFSVAPAIAPFVLTLGGGSYGVLYAVAGVCALLGALAILPVRRVR
jgi:MFS family permease